MIKMNHKLLRIILSVIFSFGMYNVSGVDPVTPSASPGSKGAAQLHLLIVWKENSFGSDVGTMKN